MRWTRAASVSIVNFGSEETTRELFRGVNFCLYSQSLAWIGFSVFLHSLDRAELRYLKIMCVHMFVELMFAAGLGPDKLWLNKRNTTQAT